MKANLTGCDQDEIVIALLVADAITGGAEKNDFISLAFGDGTRAACWLGGEAFLVYEVDGMAMVERRHDIGGAIADALGIL